MDLSVWGGLEGGKAVSVPVLVLFRVSEGDSVDTRAWDPGPVSQGLSTQALPIQSRPPL